MKSLIVQTVLFMSLLALPFGRVSAEGMLKDPVKQIELVLKKTAFQSDPSGAERLIMKKADESDAIDALLEMGFAGKVNPDGATYVLPDKKGTVKLSFVKSTSDVAIINIEVPGIKVKRVTFKK